VLVAAPDKFRGTATAREVTEAIDRAASIHGWAVDRAPLSDGGEGFLDAFAALGGTLQWAEVTGPLGRPVTAPWSLAGIRATVEMSLVSGLALAGGAAGNHPLTATTAGTGELVALAARAVGPSGTVVVGLGGSATTDGGAGFLSAVEAAGGLGGASLIGACDVDATFVEAATVFAPQKGAGPHEVTALEARLGALADQYRLRYRVDVRAIPGAGAAGGLGGAIVALGGQLRSGYQLVAEAVGLNQRLRAARLVVTGEGGLDATSFSGKVVGGVLDASRRMGVPALVMAGQATDEALATAEQRGVSVVSLTERFGTVRSTHHTVACIEEAVDTWLAQGQSRAPATDRRRRPDRGASTTG
jgi:glycerate kinase